jgi:mRNA m6A methyltransferase non-catalytic subunit
MEVLSDINHLLSAHSTLVSGVRAAQRTHRDILRGLPSPPHEILQLPMIPSPSPSPPPTPPSPPRRTRESDEERERMQDPMTRTDLPPEKRVRLARYATYVPEEETLRNDYSQRYVDGGEWPQNWVLGAELDKRFEEYVSGPLSSCTSILRASKVSQAAASSPPQKSGIGCRLTPPTLPSPYSPSHHVPSQIRRHSH